MLEHSLGGLLAVKAGWRSGGRPRPQRGAGRHGRHHGCLLALILGLAACGDDLPVEPGTLRFGQIGEARVLVVTPLRLGVGELRQTLVWVSEGPWELTESISYSRRKIIRFPG